MIPYVRAIPTPTLSAMQSMNSGLMVVKEMSEFVNDIDLSHDTVNFGNPSIETKAQQKINYIKQVRKLIER